MLAINKNAFLNSLRITKLRMRTIGRKIYKNANELNTIIHSKNLRVQNKKEKRFQKGLIQTLGIVIFNTYLLQNCCEQFERF